jgi:hypothetical protein
VNPDTWQPAGFKRVVQAMKHGAVLQHPACVCPEFEGVFSPLWAFGDSFQLLLRLVVSKRGYRAGCQMNRAPASLRLWLRKHLSFTRLMLKLMTYQ